MPAGPAQRKADEIRLAEFQRKREAQGWKIGARPPRRRKSETTKSEEARSEEGRRS